MVLKTCVAWSVQVRLVQKDSMYEILVLNGWSSGKTRRETFVALYICFSREGKKYNSPMDSMNINSKFQQFAVFPVLSCTVRSWRRSGVDDRRPVQFIRQSVQASGDGLMISTQLILVYCSLSVCRCKTSSPLRQSAQFIWCMGPLSN